MDHAFLLFGHRHYKIKKLMGLIVDGGFIVEEHVIRGGLGRLSSQDTFYFNKHLLHRRVGRIQDYFDNKSDKELDSNKEGLVDLLPQEKLTNKLN